jgi:hypothetical protein
MPVALRSEGYRFFFYSNEGDPREPMHVHVRKAEKVAKFWLEPSILLVESYAMTSAELKKIERIIDENQALIKRCWHEHFGD